MCQADRSSIENCQADRSSIENCQAVRSVTVQSGGSREGRPACDSSGSGVLISSVIGRSRGMRQASSRIQISNQYRGQHAGDSSAPRIRLRVEIRSPRGNRRRARFVMHAGYVGARGFVGAQYSSAPSIRLHARDSSAPRIRLRAGDSFAARDSSSRRIRQRAGFVSVQRSSAHVGSSGGSPVS
jgi:hypothetical protein